MPEGCHSSCHVQSNINRPVRGHPSLLPDTAGAIHFDRVTEVIPNAM
jgi:hypothetical protein